jgi:hypothetical protein
MKELRARIEELEQDLALVQAGEAREKEEAAIQKVRALFRSRAWLGPP